jgi:hypothetical protein
VSVGLDGTYRGTCIACYTPTDTALALEGEPEWIAAVLVVMGVPNDQAVATIERAPNPAKVTLRVCADCANKAEMRVQLLPGDKVRGVVQGYRQP